MLQISTKRVQGMTWLGEGDPLKIELETEL